MTYDSDVVDEVWVEFPGYPLYEVSSVGRVHRTENGKVLAYRSNARGYRIASVSRGTNASCKAFLVHRIVATAFIGPPPSNKHVIAHNDGNPLNNHVQNLRWATPKENQMDRIPHNRTAQRHYPTLTEVEVREIRSLGRMSSKQRLKAAELYNVSLTHIIAIEYHKTWKGVPV